MIDSSETATDGVMREKKGEKREGGRRMVISWWCWAVKEGKRESEGGTVGFGVCICIFHFCVSVLCKRIRKNNLFFLLFIITKDSFIYLENKQPPPLVSLMYVIILESLTHASFTLLTIE